MESGVIEWQCSNLHFVFPWDLFTITKQLKIAVSIESGGCVLHPQSSCWMHALFLFSSHLYTVSSVLHASVSLSRSAPSKGAETCTSGLFTQSGVYFRYLCPCLHVYGLSCSHIALCWVVVCVTEQVNSTVWPLGACSPAASLVAVFPAVHVAEHPQTWHHSQLHLH